MERRSVLLLLLSEASALLVAGCIFGLLLSFGFCRVIEKFNFLSIPAFNIFLTDGILLPAPTIFHVALIFCVVTVTTIFAVLFSVQTAIKITPVQALAVTE
jgi:ABC-type lipoprotein release transport system permease subunit